MTNLRINEKLIGMILQTLTVGPLATNCYILACEKTLVGAIIDPGGDEKKIVDEVTSRNLEIKYIINTHGHVDHIQANEYIKKIYSCPVCMHEKDEELLKSPDLNLLSALPSSAIKFPAPDKKLKEGEEIKLGSLSLLILHTPGHTPGSISMVVEKNVFTGDALFAGGIGRTDLPGGDYDLLMQSINKKLLALPDDFTIYPGHGPPSKIGIEKKENPFLNPSG